MAGKFAKIDFGVSSSDNEDKSIDGNGAVDSGNDSFVDSGNVSDGEDVTDDTKDDFVPVFNFDKKRSSSSSSVPAVSGGLSYSSSGHVSYPSSSSVSSPSFEGDDFDNDFDDSVVNSDYDEYSEFDDSSSEDEAVSLSSLWGDDDEDTDDADEVDNGVSSVSDVNNLANDGINNLANDSVDVGMVDDDSSDDEDDLLSVSGDGDSGSRLSFNPFLLDDDDEEDSVPDSGSDDVTSSSSVDSSVSDSFVNPFVEDDEDAGISGVGSSGVGSDDTVENVLADDDDRFEGFGDKGSVGDVSSVSASFSESLLGDVRALADRGVVVGEGGFGDVSGVVGATLPGVVSSSSSDSDGVSGNGVSSSSGSSFSSGGDSVVVRRRRSDAGNFVRGSVEEVVVSSPSSSGDSGSSSSSGSRSGGLSSSRVSNGELEFFRKLGSRSGSASALSEERVNSLRGRVDGVESEAGRKARSVLLGQLGEVDLLRRGSKVRFSEKDRDTLQLLVLFRYMTAAHVARAFSQSIRTAQTRLAKLKRQGLVVDRALFGSRSIWFVSEAGLLLSGLDLNRVTDSKLTYSMFPHQFTVNHVAANVWGANVNVLNLDDFPARNRVSEKGVPVFGERLVSELEIQSSLSKIRLFDKADVFAPQLRSNVDEAFTRWERSGGVSFGESPEMVLGNEYMWALLPPANLRKAYHVPDLVVKRDRNADGSPESIAVEVEINNKLSDKYDTILRSYRADSRMYKKVVWVCKSIGPARKLEKLGREFGLVQEGRLEILPVLTEDGVFKGRDLWLL